jgi:hypothetical protein
MGRWRRIGRGGGRGRPGIHSGVGVSGAVGPQIGVGEPVLRQRRSYVPAGRRFSETFDYNLGKIHLNHCILGVYAALRRVEIMC